MVDDLFGVIVLLQPEGAEEQAPPLRMELSREDWDSLPEHTALAVAVAPEDILLLTKGREQDVSSRCFNRQ